jgi:CubicO group peptidase (beta-lactamase class C family)
VSDELARLVRAAQGEHRLPSVAAAVVVRGEPVLEIAIGRTDDAEDREATLATQYRVGSITKTFTAAAVTALVDEGKLGLDDPLGGHVPEVGDRPLTVRRALSHSSGLQREVPGNAWETLAFPSTAELLSDLDRAEQVLEPGAWWHYSNLAYVLLGEVVARVSGLPYERFVEERLLRPLGLDRTGWNPVEPVASGYYVDPYSGVLRTEADISETSAAGGLWSTVGDLCRWGAWLRAREPMHAVQVMADPDSWLLAHGLGLMLHRRGDRILYGHDGAMPGFLASLVCSRPDDVQTAVLTNASTPAAAVTELGLGLAERTIELHPREPELWRGHEEPPAEIAEILGVWWSEGSQFVFSWRDGRLEARVVGASPRVRPSVFEPDGGGRYRVVSGRERGELLEVVRDGGGTVTKLYWATYPFTREPGTFGPPPQRLPER